MIKRLLATAILATGLAIVGGSATYAAPPVDDPNCTFEKGKTTCVQTETREEQTTLSGGEVCWVSDADGVTQFGTLVATSRIATVTTSVYKGRNIDREPLSVSITENVESISTQCHFL